MNESVTKTVSFKDLIEKRDVSVTGFGTYLIGLSNKGDVAIETSDDGLCMVLLALTVHENGGCTLYPANTDLKCYINASEEPLSGETNLIDGTKLEVADKKLMFIDGPIPKRRRKLPPTPGVSVGEAPVKPTRNPKSGSTGDIKVKGREDAKPEEAVHETNTEHEMSADQRWLETSWCLLDLTDDDQNMFRNFNTPEQISILAASYFAKQVRMFTDATVTPQLLDDIFKLCTETVDYCKDVFLNYLADISQALAKVPDRSHSRPMHGPAVRFLTELLKQCIDPVEKVILILDLLRTFSHFDSNLWTMVKYQTTAAVLGSMSVYQDIIEVQQYGVDILAKIATYKPGLDKKAPLREVGLDMVIRCVNYHSTNLALSRSSCRVLANIASTLITVLNSWLDTESATEEIISAVEQYEQLLEYVFKEGIPVIQAVMKSFGHDLGVNTEGRKFIFYYAKLQQLQLKKTKWIKSKDVENCSNPEDSNALELSETNDMEESLAENETTSQTHLLEVVTAEEETQSILKKVGSYENLRTAEKRLAFADETVGGSDSDVTYSSASENELGESFSGDTSVPVDINEVFSSQVVNHMAKKTIKRRQSVIDKAEPEAEPESSDSESESEFLQSLTVQPRRVETDISESVVTEEVACHEGKNVNEQPSSNKSEKDQLVEKEDTEINVTEDGHNVAEDNADTRAENKLVYEESESDRAQSQTVIPKSSKMEKNTESESEGGVSNLNASDIKQSAIIDVTFLGKLVRTQIVVYVGSLVFRDEDSMVLMVIDKPIWNLLEDAAAPPGLLEFARSQYGASMTLMDLEPAIVISVIDAVRYRSVTKDLVQSAVLSLTRTIHEKLLTPTLNTTMMFFKALFSDAHLQTILTDEEFLKEFRICFQNATERMEKYHSIEELRNNIASLNINE